MGFFNLCQNFSPLNFYFQLFGWFTVIFLGKIQLSLAQVTPCPCSEILDSLIHHLEKNYPGYQKLKNCQKTWVKDRFASKNESSPKACAQYLNDYLDCLKDGHVEVRYVGEIFEKERKRSGKVVWPNLNLAIAKDDLENRKTDSLEGIWESYEGLYTVLIKKNIENQGYTGYLIQSLNQNWNSGEVKMEFTQRENRPLELHYFLSSHKKVKTDWNLENNILEIKNRVVFQRIYPETPHNISIESFVSEKFGLSQDFRWWDKETFYIQLQNISAGNKRLIDNLFKQNEKAISGCRWLIVDLRGNEGGDLTCFESLWKYCLDRPVILYGTTYLCTTKNIEAYEKQIVNLGEDILPDFQSLLADFKHNSGSTFEVEDDTLYPTYGIRVPEKVVFLVDKACKSSVESFLIAVRQSGKVILAGETTGGVADYEEIVDFQLGCPNLWLQMPIGITHRPTSMAIDAIGIIPEWRIKSKNKAWHPWVKEVLKRLKNDN